MQLLFVNARAPVENHQADELGELRDLFKQHEADIGGHGPPIDLELATLLQIYLDIVDGSDE